MTEEIVNLEAKIAALNEELQLRKDLESLRQQVADTVSNLTAFKKHAYSDMIRKGQATIDDVPDALRIDVLAQIG